MTHPGSLSTALDDATDTLDDLLSAWRRLAPDSTLSRTAAYTLGALYRLGPTRLTTVAEHEAVSQPAMTGLVRRLEDAGLLVRTEDPTDGRVALVDLTDEGRERVEARRREYAAQIERMLGELGPADFDALVGALPALRRLTLLAQARYDTKELR